MTSQKVDFDWSKFERPGLMQDEIEEMKDVFDLFDVDGSHRINARDLRTCIQALNLRRNQAVHRILTDLERRGTQTVDFGVFLDLMTARVGERDSRDDVSKVFRLFDDDRTGAITAKNLQNVARELGEPISQEELAEMINRADSDGDGRVSMDDFYNLMTRRTFPH